MKADGLDGLREKIRQAAIVRLFLDYDGTLAGFAPTPAFVEPDPEVLRAVDALIGMRNVLPAVISGRRLADVQALIPRDEVLMGGAYGVEIRLPGGDFRTRAEYELVRPLMEQLKPRWQAIIKGKDGFYLEDKGWSLAIHAGRASAADAEESLAEARTILGQLKPGEYFRVFDGERFLELAPRAANKGLAVGWVLANQTPVDALPVYIGDDDKDEEAFGVVQAAGGAAIRVADRPVKTSADFQLSSPEEVRAWLVGLATGNWNLV